MTGRPHNNRIFLFLQGPHGPFFGRLGTMLRHAGATVWRVGFNAGDAHYWPDSNSYIPFTDPLGQWPDQIDMLLAEKSITDLVLYGDVRRHHSDAIVAAKARGITIHVFEEGYLRPYWITYERGGSNGNSRLMDMSVDGMRTALRNTENDTILPPSHWGDMRQHIYYGAAYHWQLMFRNRAYPNYKGHRTTPVAQELRAYLRGLLYMPWHIAERRSATRFVKSSGHPYHLALLQLEHDASFQAHSPFSTQAEFVETVINGFAKGAPGHHHLVFKGHPLETQRQTIRRQVREIALKSGIHDRIHYIHGGPMASLLNDTRSAVTVNSTAGQQVLWRGIPLRSFGAAVYDKDEFVSKQPLELFFAGATRPNHKAYNDYRRFLLETSQVPGGFYSKAGRQQALRQVVDMVLSHEDPYEALTSGTAAPRQQLRSVSD